LLNGESNISPEMALRLSKVLGRSPESWLAIQDQSDLWHAEKRVDLRAMKRLVLSAAG
jgi:addiction module HigA family antidote